MTTAARQPCLFVTGATGFIGHYALAELLRAGARCAVMLRPPVAASLNRLAALLSPIGIDPAAAIGGGLLVPVEGELNGVIDTPPGLAIDAVLHIAASTRFDSDATGEPRRTNVQGTRRLLDWATRRGVTRMHLVSSAYVCGRCDGAAVERFNRNPPAFHNDYERSKWEAERACYEWVAAAGRRTTILRPSIVVGAFASGRATKFDGFYLSARATELLSRLYEGAGDATRHAIPLRLRGRATDRQNIVPVDYVARMIVHAVRDPVCHGRTYHLVHPDPPTNDQIKRAYDDWFDVGSTGWVAPEQFSASDLNENERLFYDVSRPIEHYFVDTPSFTRHEAQWLEQRAGLACPRYDRAAIHRLIAFAQQAKWGRGGRRRRRGEVEGEPSLADYFESFLPAHVSRSRVAMTTALTATVRFIVEDEPDGQWVCRFERGRLVEVIRGGRHIAEQFGYSASREVYREAVAGRTDPREVFLSGRAEVFGDVERALKMAMILHAFNTEFPYRAQEVPAVREAS